MDQFAALAEKLGLTLQAAWPHYVNYLTFQAIFPPVLGIIAFLIGAWFAFPFRGLSKAEMEDVKQNLTEDTKIRCIIFYACLVSIILIVISSNLIIAMVEPEGMALHHIISNLRKP